MRYRYFVPHGKITAVALSGKMLPDSICGAIRQNIAWNIISSSAEIVGPAGRPIDKKLQKKSKLPRVKRAWTVENRLGGWDKSQKQFFGGGVSPRRYSSLPVSSFLGREMLHNLIKSVCTARQPHFLFWRLRCFHVLHSLSFLLILSGCSATCMSRAVHAMCCQSNQDLRSVGVSVTGGHGQDPEACGRGEAQRAAGATEKTMMTVSRTAIWFHWGQSSIRVEYRSHLQKPCVICSCPQP